MPSLSGAKEALGLTKASAKKGEGVQSATATSASAKSRGYEVFGAVRYGQGESIKHLDPEAVDAVQEGGVYGTHLYLRGGQVLEASWLSLDQAHTILQGRTDREYTRFRATVEDGNETVIALNAIDGYSYEADGMLVYLRGGQQVCLADLDLASFQRQLGL